MKPEGKVHQLHWSPLDHIRAAQVVDGPGASGPVFRWERGGAQECRVSTGRRGGRISPRNSSVAMDQYFLSIAFFGSTVVLLPFEVEDVPSGILFNSY